MDAATALALHQAFIGEIGEDIAIRRYTGSGDPRPYTDTTTRARVMGYQASPLVGQIVKGKRKVIALVDTLGAVLPLTTNDEAVIGGIPMAIHSIDDNSRRIGGTLIALELEVGE